MYSQASALAECCHSMEQCCLSGGQYPFNLFLSIPFFRFYCHLSSPRPSNDTTVLRKLRSVPESAKPTAFCCARSKKMAKHERDESEGRRSSVPSCPCTLHPWRFAVRHLLCDRGRSPMRPDSPSSRCTSRLKSSRRRVAGRRCQSSLLRRRLSTATLIRQLGTRDAGLHICYASLFRLWGV